MDQAPCALSWCTTDHSETTHPDDDLHMSLGIPFGRDDHETEVGFRQSLEERLPSLVLAQGSRHVTIPLWTARELIDALTHDPHFTRVLG